MIRIVTLTPVWRRPEIFEVCLNGLQRLVENNKERFQITPFFIVSEPTEERLIKRFGFDYIWFENNPLGAKKNAGLKHIMQNYEFDYLMELGSDDLISDPYMEIIEPELIKKTPMFFPQNVWFIDIQTGKTAYWITRRAIGLGRCIHHSVLELFAGDDYQLWLPGLNHGMDNSSLNRIMEKGIPNKILNMPGNPGIYTLDIKSEVGINTIAPFMKTRRTASEVAEFFPEHKLIMDLLQ
jgi:hypothetical protein